VVGIVVEVPSVIPVINVFVYESAFFMVGKNYLKYLLADESIPGGESGFNMYYNQSFLMQCRSLVEGLRGRKGGVRISAPAVGDPVAIPVLVGLGFNEIIAPPELISGIRDNVKSVNYLDARMVVSKITSYWDPGQAREYARERISRLRV